MANKKFVTVADGGKDTRSVSFDEANIPSANQKAALHGTHGTPGDANRYVTDSDPRLNGVAPNLKQSILSGSVDLNGDPNFLSIELPRIVRLNGSSVPFVYHVNDEHGGHTVTINHDDVVWTLPTGNEYAIIGGIYLLYLDYDPATESFTPYYIKSNPMMYFWVHPGDGDSDFRNWYPMDHSHSAQTWISPNWVNVLRIYVGAVRLEWATVLGLPQWRVSTLLSGMIGGMIHQGPFSIAANTNIVFDYRSDMALDCWNIFGYVSDAWEGYSSMRMLNNIARGSSSTANGFSGGDIVGLRLSAYRRSLFFRCGESRIHPAVNHTTNFPSNVTSGVAKIVLKRSF
jgi:hypothetical protein